MENIDETGIPEMRREIADARRATEALSTRRSRSSADQRTDAQESVRRG